MATFQQAQERANRATPQRISNDLFKFIRTIEDELAKYNVDTIKDESEGTEGQLIGFYSRATELITLGRKKAGEPYDLYETGEFLGGLFAKVENESILFDTIDPKKEEVFENLLTDNIFGLQDEDLRKAIDTKILPFFLKYLREHVF